MSIFSLCSGLVFRKSKGQLIIQLTDRCNAHCPQCSMRVSSAYTRSTLELKRCKEIIDRAAERGVAALSFTGGEPLLYPVELAALIRHAGRAGIPFIRTGTNGFAFKNPESPDFSDRVRRIAQQLAETPLRNFWISIDSADAQTHERMRGFAGVMKGIEKALPVFNQFGLYPTANLGINRNLGGAQDNIFTRGGDLSSQSNRDEYLEVVKTGLRVFLSRVKSMGFTMVNFCYPMSLEKDENGLEAVYPASSLEHIVSFTAAEKVLIFTAMLDVIPEYRDKLRIFSPLSALHTLKKVFSGDNIRPFPCKGGLDYFFINAGDGNTYPCGYRGKDNLGDYRFDVPALADRTSCNRCDWECFRDPSELMGPMVHGLRNPLSLITRYRRDSEFYSLWLKDLKYYNACELFDGRSALQEYRLRNHGLAASSDPAITTSPVTQR